MAVVAGWMATRLQIDSDVLAAAPEGVPEIEELVGVTSEFGGLDRLVVVLESAPSEREAAEELGVALGAWLAEHAMVERIESELPGLDEIVDALAPSLPALMSVEQARWLARASQPEELARAAAQLRQQVGAPGSAWREELLRLDPFGFLLPLLDQRANVGDLVGLPEGLRLLGEGALATPTGDMVLIAVRPRHAARDVRASADLLASIATEVERLRLELGMEERLDVGFAGPHALAAEDAGAIRGDLSRTTVIAVAAIALVFWSAFRGWRSLAAAALPLVLAIALTGATAALTLGTVSAVASAAAALLLGLGIDFAIVLLASEPQGDERGDPLEVSLAEAGPGIVIGALTTIATFAGFGAAHFRGLRELGWTVAIGVGWSLVMVLVVLPALAGRPLPRRTGVGAAGALIAFGRHRSALVRGGWLLLLLIAAVAIPWVEFEGSLSGLRSSNSEAMRWQQRLTDALGLDLSGMTLEVVGRDADELRDRVSRAERLLAPLLGDELVAIGSLASFLPPTESQHAGLEAFRIVGHNPHFRDDAFAALSEAGLATAPFAAAVERWSAALAAPREVSIETLGTGPLAASVRPFLTGNSEQGFRAAIHLVLPQGRFRSAPPPRLEALVREHELGRLAGLNRVSEALRREVRRDLRVCGWVAILATTMLLLLDFRSLGGAAAALFPVAPALAAMVLVSVGLGIEFSFLALFAVVMLVGIGVDYGVHMVHRCRMAGTDAVAVVATGRAVLLAAATTVGGFGSLALSSFPGLRAVGLFVAVGVSVAAVAALTVTPGLVARSQPVPAQDEPSATPPAA